MSVIWADMQVHTMEAWLYRSRTNSLCRAANKTDQSKNRDSVHLSCSIKGCEGEQFSVTKKKIGALEFVRYRGILRTPWMKNIF